MPRAERVLPPVLMVLTFFGGIGALFGGLLLAAQPSGVLLEMPLALLERTPFDSYFVPGVLLGSLGVLHLLAMWSVVRRWSSAWLLCAGAGAGMVVWISVQLAMVGYLTWLQPAYALLGLVTWSLAVALLAVERASTTPMRPAHAM